ncbi:putative reverse transcriptase domain-containing protein [Tanacetum coccineum]
MSRSGIVDVRLLYACVEYESGVLGSGREEEVRRINSKLNNLLDGSLNEGNTFMGGFMGQVPEQTANICSNTPSYTGTIPDAPSSYANKFSPMSLNKANPHKLDTNVPNDADIWLPLASVNEVNDSTENSIYGYFIVLIYWGVDSVLRDGPWMIHGFPIFLNKWCPSVSLLKEELSRVPVWVKFHDVLLVAYISDGLTLIAKKIGTQMMLDSYTNSMCLESWGRSGFARILIEVDACNGFSDICVQEEGQSATPLVEKINMFEKQILEETCVLVDYDGKPMKKVDYLDDHDNEDEVEPVDNEMANFLASKPSGLDMNKNATVSSKLNASSNKNSISKKSEKWNMKRCNLLLSEISRMTSLVPCRRSFTRGMDIDSIVCPICNAGVESTNIFFFQWVVVRHIMQKISSWWNIDYSDVNSYEEWRFCNYLHGALNDGMMDGSVAVKEVDIGLDGGRDKPLRPADMLIYSWDGGLDVCVDLTGSSPLTQTGMVDFIPGRAVIDAAQRKRSKYMAKCAAIEYEFLPFSFSSLGELEVDAITLLKRIRKFSMAQDIGARAVVHIFNRISFAIVKGVGAQIVYRLPSNLL